MVPDSMTVLTARPLKYCRLFLYECYSVNLNTLSNENRCYYGGHNNTVCRKTITAVQGNSIKLNQNKFIN